MDPEIGNYFRSDLVSVLKAVSEQDFKKFATLTTNSERVAFILRYPEAHTLPIKVESLVFKNSAEAAKFKELGNKCYVRNEFQEALEYYCVAVHFATGTNLGVILANRSAALYRLGLYDRALEDIKDASHSGYPQELMYKLLERQARCLLALKRNKKAIEAFRATLKALDIANITLEKKQKLEADIRVMLAVLGNDNPESVNNNLQKVPIKKCQTAIPKIEKCNPLYPACSISVKIRNDGGTMGRYAVATRNIEPGELLIVEKPHCSFLLPEHRLTICHRCFSGIVIPVVCQTCNVVYCTTQCRNQDADLHKKECNLLPVLWTSGVSITSYIAIKAVLQKSFQEIIKLKDKLELSKDKFEPSVNQPYKSQNYETFFGLVTHEEKRTAVDMFHRAYMASWLLRLLKTSSFIPENMKTLDSADQELSEIELFIAGLLLHHLQLVQFNAHEMTVLMMPKGIKVPSESSENAFVGGGVYPTVALLNHSCNPGIVRYYVGTTMIVRAVRTILVGEEICENYGPLFTNVPKDERKEKLKVQYWFDCNCEACAGDWPLWNDINARGLRFKCETGPACGNVFLVPREIDHFLINCVKCGKNTNILKGLKKLNDIKKLEETAADLEADGQVVEAIDVYLKMLKLLDTVLALPSQDYQYCQELVRKRMLTLGNTAEKDCT